MSETRNPVSVARFQTKAKDWVTGDLRPEGFGKNMAATGLFCKQTDALVTDRRYYTDLENVARLYIYAHEHWPYRPIAYATRA